MRKLFARKNDAYRALRLEGLESRQMLSVAPIDVAAAAEVAEIVAQSEYSNATIDIDDATVNSDDLTFTAQDTPGFYTVSWDAIDGAVSYHVQISTDGGSTWINSRTSDTTSYTAKGLAVGATTQFRIYGVNDAGKRMDSPLEGTFSRISLTTSVKSYSVGDEITVALNGADDATATVKWYRVASDGDVEITDAAGSLSYTTTQDDFGYDIKVVATGTGISEGSNSEALISANNDLAFSYDFETHQTTISWATSENAVSYRVQIQKTSGDSTKWVNCATVTETSYTAKQTYPGNEYVFRVLAYDSSNSVADVYSGSVTPTDPVFELSTSYAAYDTLDRSVSISWNAVENADHYNIQTLNSSGNWVKCAVASVDSEGNVSGTRTTYEDGVFTYEFLMHDAGVSATYRVVAMTASGTTLVSEESTYESFGLELDHDAYDVSGDTLTATTAPDTSATYQWYSSADSGSTWTAIDSATTASYTISATAAAANYWYKLVATEGSRSSVVYAEPQTFGTSKPLDLVRSIDSDGNLALTFEAVDGVATDSYQIEYYLADKTNPVWINLTQTTLTANEDGTITATRAGGENYSQYSDDQFRVRAVSDSGWSEWNGISPESPSLVVTTLDDVVDPYDFQISLREAIESYAADGDTITFDSSLDGQTITLSYSSSTYASQIDIGKSVTIDASALENGITVSGNNSSRVFNSYASDVTIKGVNISGGSASYGYGGAVAIAGGCSLTVEDATISGNAAYHGAFAWVGDAATLTLDNITASNNTASGSSAQGGVVYLEEGATVVAKNSTFSSNSATAAGGVFASATNGATITIENSKILNNTAADGAAIYAPAGTVTLTNVLVADNAGTSSSTSSAAAIVAGGTTNTYNVTVAGNEIVGLNNSGTANLYNTIVATNSTDVVSTGTTNAYNVLSSYAAYSNSDAVYYEYDSTKPLFNDADNGDYTLETKSGNQAIGKGNNSYVASTVTTDLAGNTRIQGSVVDLGAYEAGAETASLVVTTIDDVVDEYDYLVSLREAVESYASQGDTVTFDASLDGQTITLSGTQLTIMKGMTIDASSLENGITVSGNNASRVIYYAASDYFDNYPSSYDGTETLAVKNVDITGGYSSGGHGGAIAAFGILSIEDASIYGNSAYLSGGIYLGHYSTMTLDSVDAHDNTAVGASALGGFAYLEQGTTTTATNSTFTNNSSESNGGVFATDVDGATLVIENSVLTGNTATDGSAVYVPSSSGTLTLTNVLIADNNGTSSSTSTSATISSAGTASLYNVTLAGNALVGLNNSGTANLYNTIVATNDAGDVVSTGTTNAYNVLSSYESYSNSDAVYYAYDSTKPLFNDADSGDYTLAKEYGNQAVNKGNNSYVASTVATDLAGNTRIQGDVVDLGAYEASAETASLVVTSLEDVVDPYDYQITLREALESYATSGDTITFDSSLDGQTITLDGTQLEISKSVTIDASSLANGITVDANNASRALHIYGTESGVVVDGVNFKNGAVSGGYGGAIVVNVGDSLTLKNSTVSANSAYHGAAVYAATNASLVLDDVSIANNVASGTSSSAENNSQGGGVYLEQGASLTATDSTFSGNSATAAGAAIAVADGGATITIDNSKILDNTAADGAAIYAPAGTVTLTNVLVADNAGTSSSTSSAAAIVAGGTTNTYNVTIAGNEIVGLNNSGTANLYNTIVATNSTDVVSTGTTNAYNVLSSYAAYSNSDAVYYEYDSSKPLFNDADSGDYTLAKKYGTQAVDKGDNSYVASTVTTDLDGNTRIQNNVVDLGAYETGAETASLVVSSLEDVVDEYDYQVTLREALESYATSGDTITFDSSLDGQTITLAGTQLEIGKSVTIDASSLANGITVDANNASRALHIYGTESGVVVDGVNFKNGAVSGGDGGAIVVNVGDSLTLKNSTVSANSAYHGAAVYVGTNASLVLDDVTIANNAVSGTSSSAESNSQGGGVYLEQGASLTATDSTFSGNSAAAAGGAIATADGGATVVLTNVKLESNTAATASAVYLPAGTLSLTNALVVKNTSSNTSDATIIYGGDSTTMTITNATIADNYLKDNDRSDLDASRPNSIQFNSIQFNSILDADSPLFSFSFLSTCFLPSRLLRPTSLSFRLFPR